MCLGKTEQLLQVWDHLSDHLRVDQPLGDDLVNLRQPCVVLRQAANIFARGLLLDPLLLGRLRLLLVH